MNEKENFKKGLEPLVGENPQVLILGTLPGDESIRKQAYYSNARNQFWKIMNILFKKETGEESNEELIKRNGIALWDCCKCATRKGSLDEAFVLNSEEPNDIKSFLDKYPSVKTIVLNGKTTTLGLYNTYFSSIDKVKVIALTSTSGMAGSVEKKIKEWSIINRLLNGEIINKKVFIKPDSNKTNEIETLELAVFKELKTRNLKSNVRFNALKKVVDFIKRKYGRSISSIPAQKTELIADYETDKEKTLNGAEKSVINELYNQLDNIRKY